MEVSAMTDLIQKRRNILAACGITMLILALSLLFWPPEISPSLGGGVGLEYRVHALLGTPEDQDLAESSLIQAAEDTLGLPVTGQLLPSADQEDLWILQLQLEPQYSIGYNEYQTLTYSLINSFPGWTFQSSAGISQSHGTAVRTTTNYLLCLAVLFGFCVLYLLLRCRRCQSCPSAAAGAAGLLMSLLGASALSAAVGVVFDFSTVLAGLSLMIFAVYDITAVLTAMENTPGENDARECAATLAAACRKRARGLVVNTLTVSVLLLAVTVGAYHSDLPALVAFSFPLLAGLIFALFSSLVLTPLLWYEFLAALIPPCAAIE